jgi:acetyl esterase
MREKRRATGVEGSMNASVKRLDVARLTAPGVARSAEMQALFDWLTEQDKAMGVPDLGALPVAEMRAWRAKTAVRTNADPPAVAKVERLRVPGLKGAPPVLSELITPLDAEPGAVLFIHGGGWVFGDIDSHSRLARMLAVETKKRVLYIDYRLAPEHPYPAPLDDSIAAWRWIVQRAETDPGFQGPLAISGDSAGGNLSMATILHEQQLGRRAPDVAMLFYGVYDDDFDTPSYKRFAMGYGLARPGMMKFWEMYAPSETPGQPRLDPLLCPVRASEAALAKLPPVYLNASGLDPLLCDTVKMAERLEEAGATYEVNVHEGLHHGFMQQTARLSESRRAFELMGDFYRRHTKR